MCTENEHNSGLLVILNRSFCHVIRFAFHTEDAADPVVLFVVFVFVGLNFDWVSVLVGPVLVDNVAVGVVVEADAAEAAPMLVEEGGRVA